MKIEQLIRVLQELQKESPEIDVKLGVSKVIHYSKYTSDTKVVEQEITAISYQKDRRNFFKAEKIQPFIEILGEI